MLSYVSGRFQQSLVDNPELCRRTGQLVTQPWCPELGPGQATAPVPSPGSADRASAPCWPLGFLSRAQPARRTHRAGAGRPRGGEGAAGHRAGRSGSRDPRLQRPSEAGTWMGRVELTLPRLQTPYCSCGAGRTSTRGSGLLLRARARWALGQARPSSHAPGDGCPVNKRELWACRMGTRSDWAMKLTDPPQPAVTPDGNTLHPSDSGRPGPLPSRGQDTLWLFTWRPLTAAPPLTDRGAGEGPERRAPGGSEVVAPGPASALCGSAT